jgi:hypothetical protein
MHDTPDNAPERRLYQAVVAVAVEDACYGGCKRDRRRERDQARAWLLGGGKDFQFVCHAAGLDPDDIRENAERLAERGWQPASTVNPTKSPPLKTADGTKFNEMSDEISFLRKSTR